jgi:flagellar assembly factor FliW
MNTLIAQVPYADTPPMEMPKTTTSVPYDQRSGIVEIESRFGKIALDYTKPMVFEKGVLGIPEARQFCLIPYPSKKFDQFRVLQCLHDDALGFITLPIALDNPIIERADILDAIKDVNMVADYTSIVLVVNVYREVHHVRMSLNARAPIFIDDRTRQAEQYVLRNNRYLVRHMLRGDLAQIGRDAAPTSH